MYDRFSAVGCVLNGVDRAPVRGARPPDCPTTRRRAGGPTDRHRARPALTRTLALVQFWRVDSLQAPQSSTRISQLFRIVLGQC